MRTNLKAICLAGSMGIVMNTIGCSSASSGKAATGGASFGGSGSGGESASTNTGGSSQNNSPATGGNTNTSSSLSSGGKSAVGGSSAGTGGTRSTSAGASSTGSITGGNASFGGTSGSRSGGTAAVGGTTSKGSVGGNSTGGNGGASVTGSGGSDGGVGGVANSGGSTGVGGVTATGGSTFEYMLDPPDQCHDVDYLPWSNDPTTGCVSGNTASKCGGKCQTASVCEDYSSKPGADVEYMCPRDLLFSPEMEQAVIDDGFDGFHYAVVGHDPDKGGIDGNAHSCCQCYQLVFAYPSPSQERQGQINPDTLNPLGSAIDVPPPLIVQSFNTAATPTTFDIYMPAGGMGAQNGCYPVNGSSTTKQYMYTSYPLDGQPGSGGVKPVSLYQECKTSLNWVTTESLQNPDCIARTKAACDKIASNIPGLTELGSEGCLKANTIGTFYHLNWSVYAMRIECPEHLTRVTGCKLAPQGLKSAKKDVTTAAQAAKDPDFWSKTSSSNNLYETTTMEDCCRPTCASYSQISSFGLKTDPQYRSFYNCDSKGQVWTQKPQ